MHPKWLICHEQIFFGTNYYDYFHLPIGSFYCLKFLKSSYSKSRVMRMCHFWSQMVHLPQTKNLKKIINIIFIYLLAPFILQNFKKILRANLELWGYAIFGPKIPQFVANKIFWYKPLLLLSSTYWPFSLSKSFKKFLQWIQSYDNVPILGPKWSICPKQIFLENY